MEDKQHYDRVLALAALFQAAALVKEIARSGTPEIKLASVQVLGSLGDQSVFPLLLELSVASDDAVAMNLICWRSSQDLAHYGSLA